MFFYEMVSTYITIDVVVSVRLVTMKHGYKHGHRTRHGHWHR